MQLLRGYLPTDYSFNHLFDHLQHIAEQHVSYSHRLHTVAPARRSLLTADAPSPNSFPVSQSLLDLDDTTLDDYIPINTVSALSVTTAQRRSGRCQPLTCCLPCWVLQLSLFLSYFLAGFLSMFAALGLHSTHPPAQTAGVAINLPLQAQSTQRAVRTPGLREDSARSSPPQVR